MVVVACLWPVVVVGGGGGGGDGGVDVGLSAHWW